MAERAKNERSRGGVRRANGCGSEGGGGGDPIQNFTGYKMRASILLPKKWFIRISDEKESFID